MGMLTQSKGKCLYLSMDHHGDLYSHLAYIPPPFHLLNDI